MRDPEPLCRRAAEAVVFALAERGAVRLPPNRGPVVEKVEEALLNNFRLEGAIAAEAERLADEHIQSERGVDRRRVVDLIKHRLAEEKNFAL